MNSRDLAETITSSKIFTCKIHNTQHIYQTFTEKWEIFMCQRDKKVCDNSKMFRVHLFIFTLVMTALMLNLPVIGGDTSLK